MRAPRKPEPVDEADGEARTVSDRHGDEAGEHGQHEAERGAADVLEEFRGGRVRAEVLRVDAVIVEQERERDEDAAADDEREHVADAVHEVLVDLAGEALAGRVRRALGLIGAFRMVDGSAP